MEVGAACAAAGAAGLHLAGVENVRWKMTRRRMARERRGAGSSLSMETILETIY